MDIKLKNAVPVFIVLLFVIVAAAVVGVIVGDPQAEIQGFYISDTGQEITFGEDGKLTDFVRPEFGLGEYKPMTCYWVEGDNIRMGYSKDETKATFKIESDGKLVGNGTTWTKTSVRPTRPDALTGTYSNAGDRESLGLVKSGAFYDTQPGASAFTIMKMGIWSESDNVITVKYTSGDSFTVELYDVVDNKLVDGDREYEKVSEEVNTATR